MQCPPLRNGFEPCSTPLLHKTTPPYAGRGDIQGEDALQSAAPYKRLSGLLTRRQALRYATPITVCGAQIRDGSGGEAQRPR